jgi:GNAT superfamily N-acetyltransferase
MPARATSGLASVRIILPFEQRFGAHRCVVRCLCPDDAPRLLDFFRSHTPETIHDRYGFFVSHLSPARAARLVGVDQTRDMALGVFESGGNGALIAVGRYCLESDGRSAEVAFVVREDRRRLGIATTLLTTLAGIAGERGLDELTAQVLSRNEAMLRIFRRAGATCITAPDTFGTTVVLELPGRDRRATVTGRTVPVDHVNSKKR